MLEALDDVPWAALSHAYGSAEDVPGLIRSIAFGDREAREAAWNELYGNLWHQGTVYEASSRAVPFLLEIADQSDTPDLHEVIVYLACLARGSSYLDVHQHLIYPSGLTTLDEKAQLTRELEWVRRVREEARKGLPLFVHLLDHHDPRVRSAACHMLGCLPEDSSTIAPHLHRLFERGDADAGSRAACVLAIGEIGRVDATCPQQVRDVDPRGAQSGCPAGIDRSGLLPGGQSCLLPIATVAMNSARGGLTFARTKAWGSGGSESG
jgi:hypothetical protein